MEIRSLMTRSAIVVVCFIFISACGSRETDRTLNIKLLAVNDFHGQLPAGQTFNGRQVGSIPVIGSYFRSAIAEFGTDRTIIVFPGDMVAASPPESGLLLDEPSILFFNQFANSSCIAGSLSLTTGCNMIATLGNHDFDKGLDELYRRLNGGNGTTTVTHIEDPYPGAKPYFIVSNVKRHSTGELLLQPYVIKEIEGVKIAFIGVVTAQTKNTEMPDLIVDLDFLDEVQAINSQVATIKQTGIKAVVVLIHEGGTQTAYDGPTQDGGVPTGRITEIVSRLDGEVDVVLSGHTHKFTNAYLNNAAGKPVLVTQAYSYGKGYADVYIAIDRYSGDIVKKTAIIQSAYADQSPGNTPDPEALALLEKSREIVSPTVNKLISFSNNPITKTENDDGESQLGDLIADSYLAYNKNAQMAFLTAGSLRFDLAAGNITWGKLYQVLPFGNSLVMKKITGDQIRRVLEQQWTAPYNLQISGLSYSYSASAPAGTRIQDLMTAGVPVDPSKTYTAILTDYLSAGLDNYTVFAECEFISSGPTDLDAAVSYIGALPQPLDIKINGRIKRKD